MTRRQQGLWDCCHSCRACPCASPRPCPNKNPGACSRTPADSCLGGAWPRKTSRQFQPASSRGWCSKKCRRASLSGSPVPPGSTAQVFHRGSLACATLETRSPRHRHGRQTRFSAGLRLCWHGAFVYGGHISSLQFGLRILGHRGKPGRTAQCIHVPVPSKKSRRPLHSPSLFP